MTPPASDLARPDVAKVRQRVTILGVGNTLLADEGIGVHVIRHLQRADGLCGGIELIDGGTLSFNLVPAIEATGCLIVVDAANFGGVPGSVRCFVGGDLDQFLGSSKHTAHEVGLRELLDKARLDGHLPARRALIGVQPQRVDWGETPTKLVAAALPHVADLAIRLADEWCRLPIDDARRG